MKNFLKWLFKNEWEEFCIEMREKEFWHNTQIERNFVAEKYLKHLGYKLVWNDPLHKIEKNQTPLPADSYGWRLEKLTNPHE